MSDSVFRTAQDEPTNSPAPAEPVAKVDDSSSSDQIHVPELIATYQEDQGKPYVAEYFEVPDMWNKEENLKYELETIENYIRKQVSEKKLANSTKAANDFLKAMEKEAKIQRYDSPTNRISKLVAFIEFKEFVHG